MRNNQNPWIGLRAYVEGETLYGRDREILELTTFVMAETEVVLYGKSGTGKSSIINAGVIPSARRNGYIPLTIRLEHNSKSPDYVTQIKNAIQKTGVVIREVVPPHSCSKTLLWELFHCNEFLNSDGSRAKLLIIFDQFEEVFTLQEQKEKRELFFKEVADILNNIKPRELCAEETRLSSATVNDNAGKEPSDDDIFTQIEQLNLEECISSSSYIDNCVHFLFALREDYLSDFEFYTQNIPALKHHRYSFRPIEENQALEIIMNPQKGLVSESVAKQIVAKISKTSDGESSSSSGIDTAILSLFLSQLYQRLPENATSITTDMLDKFGKNIIHDFYISTVSDESRIRPEAVRWLEQILLTKDNHRDNKDIKDVLDRKNGLTAEELKYLEKDKRILTRFKRSKTTRIEFVHDVIAEVASQHKLEAEAEATARKEQALQSRKARRKLWMTIAISSLILLCAIMSMWAFIPKQTDGLPVKQPFMISFLEDSLTTENEYWKGDLSIIGHRAQASDTVLFKRIVDKGLRDSMFKIEVDTLRSVSFSLKFPSYSKYQDIEFEKDYSELVKALNVQMQLRKKQPKTYPYYGNVSVEYNGKEYPAQNTLICLHDITTRTDSAGNFRYYLEKELSDEDDIFIIKKGFSSVDFKAVDNLKDNIHRFVLEPKDSIQSFRSRIATIDSVAKANKEKAYYMRNKKIFLKDGSTDVLNLCGSYIKTIDQKYIIEGYFYLKSGISNNNEIDDLCSSYYLFTGYIDRKWTDGVKNYSIEGKNFIGNTLDITGTFKEKGWIWTGEVTSPVGFNATFPKD